MSGDFRIELRGNIYAAEARAALDDVLQRLVGSVLRIGNATIDYGAAIEMPSADPKGA